MIALTPVVPVVSFAPAEIAIDCTGDSRPGDEDLPPAFDCGPDNAGELLWI